MESARVTRSRADKETHTSFVAVANIIPEKSVQEKTITYRVWHVLTSHLQLPPQNRNHMIDVIAK